MLHQIVTLSNGKKVGNFSSPHEFKFEDGSILPAINNEDAERLSVKFIETDMGNGDMELSFELTEEITKNMEYWSRLHAGKSVDVVFVPLPMLQAIKERWVPDTVKVMPFRAIRMVDRCSKLVSISKQCI